MGRVDGVGARRWRRGGMSRLGRRRGRGLREVCVPRRARGVPMSRKGARALGRIDGRRVLVDGARPVAIAATLAR